MRLTVSHHEFHFKTMQIVHFIPEDFTLIYSFHTLISGVNRLQTYDNYYCINIILLYLHIH